MKQRKPHIKTAYETARGKYRAESPRHVVQFETDMGEEQKRHSFSLADEERQLENSLKGVLLDRIIQMKRTKHYRELAADYGYCVTRMERVKKGSDEYAALEKRKAAIGRGMSAMQEEFRITWDDTRHEMERLAGNSRVHSVFCLRGAESVWQAVEKILFSDGKRLRFRKRGDLPCLRAKQPNRAICMKSEDGQLRFSVDGIGKFGIKVPEKDLFLKDELTAILQYMFDPESCDKEAVGSFMQSGIIQGTFRPCYASLKCIRIRGKLRVYVQVTVDGIPFPKRKQDGTLRYDFSKTGIVGCDIGTQSVAVVSENRLIFDNLGERDHVSTKASEALERRLLRKMDRSRRAANPDNYYPDGSIRPRKMRKPWVYSKTYVRTRDQYAEVARRNADSRKYANRKMANKIRSSGDVLFTEPKNAKKLQRKARESKITIRADGSLKYSKRKRFGRSIHHRSPGQFQAELKLKFGNGYHEVPYKYRASQYDHTADKYIKKGLNDRMYRLSDGTKVQRDLYSAFLLAHPDTEIHAPDHGRCCEDFPVFLKQMDALIAGIKASGYKICNSGI